MDNAAVLQDVANAIQTAQNELNTLDSLSEAAVTAQNTIQTLESNILALRSNTANLDAATRATQLTAATSALSLAQGDLLPAQAAVDAQQAVTIAAGSLAAKQVQAVRNRLFQQRRANAETAILAAFVTNQIPCPVSLTEARLPTIESKRCANWPGGLPSFLRLPQVNRV